MFLTSTSGQSCEIASFGQQWLTIYTPGKLPFHAPKMFTKCFLTLLLFTKIGRLESWRVCFLDRVTTWWPRVTKEVVMKPRFQYSTRFSWPSRTSLSWLCIVIVDASRRMDSKEYKRWRFIAGDKPSRSTLWRRRKLKRKVESDDQPVKKILHLEEDHDPCDMSTQKENIGENVPADEQTRSEENTSESISCPSNDDSCTREYNDCLGKHGQPLWNHRSCVKL